MGGGVAGGRDAGGHAAGDGHSLVQKNAERRQKFAVVFHGKKLFKTKNSTRGGKNKKNNSRPFLVLKMEGKTLICFSFGNNEH